MVCEQTFGCHQEAIDCKGNIWVHDFLFNEYADKCLQEGSIKNTHDFTIHADSFCGDISDPPVTDPPKPNGCLSFMGLKYAPWEWAIRIFALVCILILLIVAYRDFF